MLPLSPEFLNGFAGAALGLIAGSFLATLLIRWPDGLNAAKGRSRCDSCARALAWHELIPLVSFAIAGGRCRTCRAPISLLHPAVEATCAAAGAVCFAAGWPGLAPLAWLLIVLMLFDALHLWLPDLLIAPLALAAILAPGMAGSGDWQLRLIGGAAGFAALWLVAMAFRRITGREGLGRGDPKLFGAIGLWSGPANLPLLLVAACALGLLDAALRLARGGDRSTMRLPLGSYLSAATLAAILFTIAAGTQ